MLLSIIDVQKGLDNMQDYMFFVTASYTVAGVILAGLMFVTMWNFFSTKKRFNTLINSKEKANES